MGSKSKLCSQVEVQQKIIADFEAGKLAWDARQAELNKEVPVVIKLVRQPIFIRLRRRNLPRLRRRTMLTEGVLITL